jgi:hypothetical protein
VGASGGGKVTGPTEIYFSHTLGYQCHPPQFAAWSTPEWAIVSGGQQDRLEVMAGAYEAQGAKVLHTAVRGAVQVKIVGRGLSVDAWRATRE